MGIRFGDSVWESRSGIQVGYPGFVIRVRPSRLALEACWNPFFFVSRSLLPTPPPCPKKPYQCSYCFMGVFILNLNEPITIDGVKTLPSGLTNFKFPTWIWFVYFMTPPPPFSIQMKINWCHYLTYLNLIRLLYDPTSTLFNSNENQLMSLLNP